MAVFDAVVNNADRKIGHLLPAAGRATCTAATTGSASARSTSSARCCGSGGARQLPGTAVEALRRLRHAMAGGELGAAFGQWLAPDEVEATRQRVELLLEHRVHPFPPDDWPAVPWPPY